MASNYENKYRACSSPYISRGCRGELTNQPEMSQRLENDSAYCPFFCSSEIEDLTPFGLKRKTSQDSRRKRRHETFEFMTPFGQKHPTNTTFPPSSSDCSSRRKISICDSDCDSLEYQQSYWSEKKSDQDHVIRSSTSFSSSLPKTERYFIGADSQNSNKPTPFGQRHPTLTTFSPPSF